MVDSSKHVLTSSIKSTPIFVATPMYMLCQGSSSMSQRTACFLSPQAKTEKIHNQEIQYVSLKSIYKTDQLISRATKHELTNLYSTFKFLEVQ